MQKEVNDATRLVSTLAEVKAAWDAEAKLKRELLQIVATGLVWLEKINEETPEHGT